MSAQLEQLRSLIGELVDANGFYGPRLKRADVPSNISSLEEFARRMPLTEKNDFLADQAAHPPYGSNLTFPLERYSRFCQTTGTSGRPLVWLDTAESWDWMLANWARIYRAAGVDIGDRIYFAFSFGPFLGFWTAFEAATKLGFLCLPGGGHGSSARLRTMIDHGATVLCCTPTYALRLAEVAATEGIDLGKAAVQKIIVAGEPGGSVADVRARIASAWHGAQIVDHYGMTEVGPAAFEERPGVLRILAESYFAEIVDPQTGAAVAAGTTGELVLTTLGRVASPAIRYRTGDLVKRVAEPEGFALDGGVIGRVDDMVVVRGVNIYPSAVDAVVRSVAGVAEYRVEVSRRGEMVELALQIECARHDIVTEMERALNSAFSLRIPVLPLPEGTLPRFEMKARRWIRRD